MTKFGFLGAWSENMNIYKVSHDSKAGDPWFLVFSGNPRRRNPVEGCRKSKEWYRRLGLPPWSTSPLPFLLPWHEELTRLLALPLVSNI